MIQQPVDPHDAAPAAASLARDREAWALLSAEERLVLRLACQGLTYIQIAGTTGADPSAVMRQMCLALRTLRRAIDLPAPRLLTAPPVAADLHRSEADA